MINFRNVLNRKLKDLTQTLIQNFMLQFYIEHENYWLEIRDFDFLLTDVSRFLGIFEI